MKFTYKTTVKACFVGYIVQAIVNTFVPLLFLTLQKEYAIPLSKITSLVTINFSIQLVIDLTSALFVDKIGYRAAGVIAHIFSALGLVLLTFLPSVMPSAYAGILISVVCYAIGGGLLEVMVSPIIESCPTDNKEKAMSMLHSFYCWGYVGVVLISTVFFKLAGISNWRILAAAWAVIPVVNCFVFLKIPIAPILPEGEKGLSIKQLCTNRVFILLFILMVCAGACEQSVSQWSSTYAEKGLGVSKAVGDLAGPLSFALLMGISRLIFGRFGEKLNLDRFMFFSTCLCVASYVCVSFFSSPVVGMIGCALCGFSVGIMWPGTFSKATAAIPKGGTAMFALLALAGDLGCSAGPTLVGAVASHFGDRLSMGFTAAMAFPVLMIIALMVLEKVKKSRADG